MVRYLPLAFLAPLSALCVEAVAQPRNESVETQIGSSDVAELVEDNSQANIDGAVQSANQPDEPTAKTDISGASDSETLEVMEPLVLSQSNDSASASEEEEEEESWRFYLDLYAFAPLSTSTTTKLNGNAPVDAHSSLADVFATTKAGLTFKASAEYGRFGIYSGVNYGAAYQSETLAKWKTKNLIGKKLGLPTDAVKFESKGKIDATLETSQFIYDLAVRYRAGAIQKPKMEKGSSSFVGFVGARFIDGWMKISLDSESTITANSEILNAEQTRKFENSVSGTWANTWVQPLIGMLATYSISEDWQAFAYLDAGGFGLAGERDLTGTAQAGIAYALGNSAQASLSYKYFGLDYDGGSGNGYTSRQSGINFGLRWLFD